MDHFLITISLAYYYTFMLINTAAVGVSVLSLLILEFFVVIVNAIVLKN